MSFRRKKPIIVAIDDEAVIVNAVLTALEKDYEVKPFVSGETAMKYLETQTADLVLVDYQMPNLTGLQILEQLQKWSRTKDIPIVFLTGETDGNNEVEVLEKGAVDYILKPIKPRVLLTRIRLQLELQEYRHHLEQLVAEKLDSLSIAYNKLKIRENITLDLLAQVTDLRDHDTGSHIKRTTEFVRILVSELRATPREGYILTQTEGDDIISSAKLHDIGKIAIPDHILLKPGKLTEEEFEVIKRHPTHGAQLLQESILKMGGDSFLDTARDIALSHHEKWDGTGYPYGLKGEAIPLPARIAAIADVYDALTTVRPYKEAYPHELALKTILKQSGKHFDPYLVDVFLKREQEFEKINLADL